jgi:exonuclease III
VNRGIRLDYFICSPQLFDDDGDDDASANVSASASARTSEGDSGDKTDSKGTTQGDQSERTETATAVTDASSSKHQRWRAYDSYILDKDTVGCSDHCPVMLVMVKH